MSLFLPTAGTWRDWMGFITIHHASTVTYISQHKTRNISHNIIKYNCWSYKHLPRSRNWTRTSRISTASPQRSTTLVFFTIFSTNLRKNPPMDSWFVFCFVIWINPVFWTRTEHQRDTQTKPAQSESRTERQIVSYPYWVIVPILLLGFRLEFQPTAFGLEICLI